MDKIVNLLNSIGIPYAYHHFAEGEVKTPPFICYLTPNSNYFYADGKAYEKIKAVHIELYTDKKDPVTEARVEAVLDAARITYSKSETWIESENLYEVLFYFEI